MGEVLKLTYKKAFVSAVVSLYELINTNESVKWAVHIAVCRLQLENTMQSYSRFWRSEFILVTLTKLLLLLL